MFNLYKVKFLKKKKLFFFKKCQHNINFLKINIMKINVFFHFNLLKFIFKFCFNYNSIYQINMFKLKYFFITSIFKKSFFLFKKTLKSLDFLQFLLYLYLSFFFKKILWLAYFCKKLNSSVQFLQIKTILYFYRIFFKKYWYFIQTYFHINGLVFFFKGKIGSSGNKRKKKFLLKYGSNSSTNFQYNNDQKVFPIITPSGLINAKLILYY
jgi:hypothetical protein